MKSEKTLNPLFKVMLPLSPRKGDHRKLEILAAGLTCLAEGGFENFNYNTIGKAAGVPRSLVAHYFPDKKEMLYLMVYGFYQDLQLRVVKKIRRESDPKRQITQLILATIEGVKALGEGANVFLLFGHVCSYDESYRKKFIAIRAVGAERLQSILTGYTGLEKLSYKVRYKIARGVQAIISGGISEQYTTNWKSSSKQLCLELELQVSAYISASASTAKEKP